LLLTLIRAERIAVSITRVNTPQSNLLAHQALTTVSILRDQYRTVREGAMPVPPDIHRNRADESPCGIEHGQSLQTGIEDHDGIGSVPNNPVQGRKFPGAAPFTARRPQQLARRIVPLELIRTTVRDDELSVAKLRGTPNPVQYDIGRGVLTELDERCGRHRPSLGRSDLGSLNFDDLDPGAVSQNVAAPKDLGVRTRYTRHRQ
jgi:hypothetical protein